MHRLLKRQLKKLSLNPDTPPDAGQWADFIKQVEHSYSDNDQDRYTLERSLKISSEEMRLLYDQQKHSYEGRLQAIFHALPDLVWLKDLNGVYLACNSKFERFFGAKWSEIIGKTDYDFVDRELADIFTEKDRSVMESGETRVNEEKISFADDAHIELLETIRTPMFDLNGKLIGVLGVGRDVTERKQTELALRRSQKMDAIGQLTGGIAHDFNNILAIILGNVELLKQQTLDNEKIHDRVQVINKSARRAAGLTKQLLSFSRHLPGKTSTININPLIEGMQNLIERSITPEVVIKYQLARDLWFTNIDPGDLEDALLNLILNARDAMDGHGRLTIQTGNIVLDSQYCDMSSCAEAGEYIQLVVSDNGKGMSAEELEHLYEPFFTTKEQGKGTGLGMSMVYGFVQRSGGCINTDSQQGIGTSFRLYLPRAGHEIQESATHTQAALPLHQGSGTILIVDDEEALRKLAAESLQPLGYRVITAADGQQALAVLATEDIDLLFSDVVMPGGLNGYELARQAAAKYPQLRILLTSGYTGKAGRSDGQARFSANLLIKPYARAELAQRIQALLNTPARIADNKPVKWTDALSIGIGAVDDDHRILIEMLNRCRQADEASFSTLLDQMVDFTVIHFKREEVVMAACDYPWIDNHHQVHQLLVAQTETMRERLDRGELSIDKLVDFLDVWLLDHTQGMDRAFAPYCTGRESDIKRALAQMDTTS